MHPALLRCRVDEEIKNTIVDSRTRSVGKELHSEGKDGESEEGGGEGRWGGGHHYPPAEVQMGSTLHRGEQN